MKDLLLDLLALTAILSGIFVITAKNPVISVLFLISVFVNVAGYLVLLGVTYLGLAYLIIYVGAIAVLFLFVIMMLNLQLAELINTGKEYTQNLPLGAILSSLFLVEFFFFAREKVDLSLLFNFLNSVMLEKVHVVFFPVIADNSITTFLQIENIGQGLYTYASL
jgi:NADH-ubiquinone oxidoreductase chain 6